MAITISTAICHSSKTGGRPGPRRAIFAWAALHRGMAIWTRSARCLPSLAGRTMAGPPYLVLRQHNLTEAQLFWVGIIRQAQVLLPVSAVRARVSEYAYPCHPIKSICV